MVKFVGQRGHRVTRGAGSKGEGARVVGRWREFDRVGFSKEEGAVEGGFKARCFLFINFF